MMSECQIISQIKVMNNDIIDFFVLEFFGISNRSEKVSHPIQVV